MKPRTLLVTAALAAVIVLAAALAYGIRGGSFTSPASPERPAGADSPFLTVDEHGGNRQDQARRQEARVQELVDRLRELQKRPGNFQAFLAELYQQCQERAECDALLDAALARYPDREFAAMVARLRSRLPAYEQAMQSLVMSTDLSPRERYDRLWALREQMLGREEALFAFGQEKAYADYQFRYGDLLAKAATLSPEQRLSELQKLRDGAAGEYTQLLTGVEGNAGAYERERELLLVGVTDPAEQARITAMLRRRHFDATTVAQMEARDTQLAEQATAVAAYQTEARALRQELEALRPTLSEAAWQSLYDQRMTELRLRHFP